MFCCCFVHVHYAAVLKKSKVIPVILGLHGSSAQVRKWGPACFPWLNNNRIFDFLQPLLCTNNHYSQCGVSSVMCFTTLKSLTKIELNRTVFFLQALSFSSLAAVCCELSQPCHTDSFPALLCSFLSLLDGVACIGETTTVSCRMTIFCVWVPWRKNRNRIFFEEI